MTQNSNPDIIHDTNPKITFEGSSFPRLQERMGRVHKTQYNPRQHWSEENNK